MKRRAQRKGRDETAWEEEVERERGKL